MFVLTFRHSLTFLLFILLVSVVARAQSTAFTYQGNLSNGGNPATGYYDLQFKLFDTVTVGTGAQQGSTVTVSNAYVNSGVFTVELDFGAAAFDGNPRYLEIGVRPAGSSDPYTLLSPRQAITSTPYALRSANSAAADGLSPACAGCVTDTHIQTVDGGKITGNIAGSQISGAVPVESVPTGSNNYIQNAAALQRAGKNAIQQAAGFNVDGAGVVGGNFVTNGNVGIGNDAPLSKLHITSGDNDYPPRLEASRFFGLAAGIDFYHGTTQKGYVGAPGSQSPIGPAEMILYAAPGTKTSLWTNGTKLVTLNTDGKIGIGSFSPTSKVEIAAQDALSLTGFNPFITFRDTGNNSRVSYIQGVNGDLAFIPQSFSPNGVAMVVKDVSGNVGIGLNNPSARLQVATGNQPGIRADSQGNAILGYSTTPSFAAIYGENNNAASFGVYGKSTLGKGIFGETISDVGVYGKASITGTGVQGEGSTGVVGTGIGRGVEGRSTGSTGIGVYGEGNTGVRGAATGRFSFGIYGVAVGGDSSSLAAYLDGSVHISFDTLILGGLDVLGDKSFVEPHPTDPNKMIRYIALEGPESGTYFRGSGRIVNGVATIQVPEDFRLVTDEKGITVQVTPVGAPATIWCVRKSLDQIELRGSADVEFDFMVNGVRRLSKDHQPIVENTAFVPRSADENPFKWIDNPAALRRLKDNGILNEDGTVNMETVKKLDFYKRTHKQ